MKQERRQNGRCNRVARLKKPDGLSEARGFSHGFFTAVLLVSFLCLYKMRNPYYFSFCVYIHNMPDFSYKKSRCQSGSGLSNVKELTNSENPTLQVRAFSSHPVDMLLKSAVSFPSQSASFFSVSLHPSNRVI